jgi:hypothetical protein
MPRGKLHTRGTNNRCKACGEPFPCPAIINARDISHHQVVPTTAVHARDFERQLRPMLEALTRFEHELSNYADQDRRERARHDSIAVAIKHLQGALDALKQASQE